MTGVWERFSFPYARIFILLTAWLFCSVAMAVWYGGGSYDGYSGSTNQVIMGFPVVDNAAGATNVLNTSAYLNGTLLDTGAAPAVVYVYYGATDGATNKAAWANSGNFGNCTNDQALSTNATGLAQATTYYYRFYVTNTAGDDAWANYSASFTTFIMPVLDNGPGAMPVSFTTATLNGNLSTTSGVSVIAIYWGQNTNNWDSTNSMGSLSPGAFHTAVSGLSSGAVYYYRCYGTNAYGEGWSDISSFMTRSPETFAIYAGGSYDGYSQSSLLNAVFPWWYMRFRINGIPCEQIKSIEGVPGTQLKSINGGSYGAP